MPDRERALRAAHTIITRCLALPTDSELAIVADETTLPIAEVLAEAAETLQHHTHLIYFHSGTQARLSDETRLAESVKSALRDVAGTVLCVNGSPATLAFRDTIRRAAWRKGNRVAHMPGVNWRILFAADADYDELAHTCEVLSWALVKGQRIRIITLDRSGQAHVLSADLGKWLRMPIVSDGIIPDGVWGNVPSGETYIAPIEGSAQGEIVINGALPGRVLAPREELILRFEAGRLVDAWPRGGEAHAHLYEGVLRHARAQNDPNWDVLGEIGLGANRRIRRLSGTSLLDEKKYGTIHIALGDNEDMGGEVRSLVHCDLVSLRPGVTIDDKPILSRGRITLREPDWREDHRALALPDDWHTRTLLSLSGIEAMVNGRGQLYRRWTTSSGRECGIPVGNEASATRAAGLWRAIKDSTRPIEMNELPSPSREARRGDSDRLVYLLERYGLVRTN